MALGRLDIPGLVFYTGSIAPGLFRGREVSIARRLRGHRRVRSREDQRRATCTSSSRSRVPEQAPAAGSSPPTRCPRSSSSWASAPPAPTASRRSRRRRRTPPSSAGGSSSISSAETSGRPRSSRARRSRMRRRRSSRPAAPRTASCTSLAIAYEFGIPFTIDDFDEIAGRTPVLADMKPWGRYHATDVYRAGGVGLVARELKKRDLVHAGAPTVERPDARGGRRTRGRDRRAGRDRGDRDSDQDLGDAARSSAATWRPRAA